MAVANGSLRFDAGTAASPVAEGLAQVAAETQQLLAENGAVLRACHAPGCVLYFAAPAAALGPGTRTGRPGAPAGVLLLAGIPDEGEQAFEVLPAGTAGAQVGGDAWVAVGGGGTGGH